MYVYTGTFRIACERIMTVLRSNREIILSLLDAFVYEPLIEWTSANDEGEGNYYYIVHFTCLHWASANDKGVGNYYYIVHFTCLHWASANDKGVGNYYYIGPVPMMRVREITNTGQFTLH